MFRYVCAAAVHHRATECPTQYPRKLVRTTVSNDYPPAFDAQAVAGAPVGTLGSLFDLSRDRVNAVYPAKGAVEESVGGGEAVSVSEQAHGGDL
jgi:hypothetical protein